MGPIGVVGWSAAGLVTVLWLVVSFTQPSPRRTLVEWSAAVGLYLALSMFFLSLVLDALESGSRVALIAFGLLLAVFSVGGIVAFVSALRALRGAGESGGTSGATN